MPNLQEDLQKSFENPQHQVLLNVLYTSAFVKQSATLILKPHGLTWQQFSILRSLRDLDGAPASMRMLQERMLDPQSNASRLVDKLVEKKLVNRVTSDRDRRQVGVTLTDSGLDLVTATGKQMSGLLAASDGGLSAGELETLSTHLDQFRDSLRAYNETLRT